MKRIFVFQTILAAASIMLAGDRNSLWAAATPPVTDGLVLAFDGSDVTTNAAGLVTSWADQALGGGTHPAVQATDNRRPYLDTVNTLNGHRVLVFDGVNSALSDQLTSAYVPDAGITIFAVVRRDTQTTGVTSLRTIVDVGSGKVMLMVGSGDINGTIRIDYGTTAASATWHPIYNGQYHVLCGVGAAGASATEIRAEGFQRAANSPASDPTFGAVTIGGQFNYDERHFAGAVAEVLVYDDVLSYTQRRMVEGYLGEKYGLDAPYPPPATDLPVTDGLKAHFDANYASTNGSGKVYVWESRTLDNMRAEQGTVSKQPVTAPDARFGNTAVRFNHNPSSYTVPNTPEYLPTTYTPGASDNVTVFTMIRPSGNSYESGGSSLKTVTCCGDPGGLGLYSLLHWPGTLYVRSQSAAENLPLSSVFTDFHVTSAVVTNGGIVRGWYDGELKHTADRTGVTPTVFSFRIGGDGQLESRGFSGDMLAEIIYNRALTDEERKAVEDYLWREYGPPRGTTITVR